MARTRLSVVLLLVCALFLGACGSDSSGETKAQYTKDAKAIIDQAKASLQSFSTRAAGKPADQQVKEIARTRQEVVAAADRLAKLDPPSDVKPEHDRFVTALRTFGEDFQKIEQAAKANDRAAVGQAQQKLKSDVSELQTAGAALDAKLK